MELEFLLYLTSFLLFLLFLFRFKHGSSKLPPGPKKLPLIGNIHQLTGLLPHHALRDLSRKYGPLMHLQLGEISAVIVSSSTIAKELFKKNDLALAERQITTSTKIFSYDGMDIAFSPYGDYWRQMRKLCLSEVLSVKKVQSFSPIREDEVCKLIESIRSSGDSPINVTEKIYSTTSNIISRSAFGSKCKDQEVFVAVSKKATSISGGFDLADLFPSVKFLQWISGRKDKLVMLFTQADNILDGILKQHREESLCKGDMVDALLCIQKSENLSCPISDRNIKAIISDMFHAGLDTSANVLEWTMSELIRNPRVMKKVQAEVREALNGKKKILESDIQELVYFKSVIKETLRLHPPLSLLIPRECRESFEVYGYEIPIKTKVMFNAWAIGRDPDIWEDPESFIPERFIDSLVNFKGSDFEYIPFGAGRRICPGISFGLSTIDLQLALLLYNFNWTLTDGIKPENLDMTESFGVVVRRKTNLYLTATPYTPPSWTDSTYKAASSKSLVLFDATRTIKSMEDFSYFKDL